MQGSKICIAYLNNTADADEILLPLFTITQYLPDGRIVKSSFTLLPNAALFMTALPFISIIVISDNTSGEPEIINDVTGLNGLGSI